MSERKKLPSHPIAGYAVAVLAIAVAVAVWRIVAWAVGGSLPHYITCYPAVIVTALLAGLGPGILATVLGGVAAAYWIIPPDDAFFPMTLPDAVGLGMFFVIGVSVTVVAELYRRSRRRVAAFETRLALREQQVRAAAVETERQRFNDVLELLPACICLLTPDHQIPFANRRFREQFGELDGRRCFEHNFQRGEPCDQCQAFTPLRTHGPHQWELAAPDGRYYEIHTVPFTDPDGSPLILEMTLDITEGKRAAAALQQANESLRSEIADRVASQEAASQLAAIVESSDDAILSKTLGGTILSWNQGAERLLGYTADEVRGKPVAILAPPERAHEIPQILERIGRGEKVDHFQTERIAKDGRRIAVALSISPVRDRSGKIVGASTIARDITEQQRLEAELRTASLYARSLIEASLDPLVTISQSGQIMDVNQATELVTGVGRDKLIGSDFSAYFTDPEKANQGYHEVLAQGFVKDYALTIRHASGRTTDVLYNATVFHNQAGEVQGVFAAARDVTRRKRAEEEVRRASLYARSLIEASLDPLVTISPAGQITDVNRATEEVTGVGRESLIGSDFSRYFTEPEKANAGYQKVLADGFVHDYPLTIRHTSGRTTDVLYNATVYRNEAGEVQGVFAAARDVTRRKRAEEEVRRASLYARSLIEASLDPLVTISPAGQITDVNRATEEVTGVGRESLIGSDFSRYFTEPEKASAGYQKVLADGFVHDYPLTIRHTSGRTTDVLYNATVYRNEAGEVQGVFAAARDVTDRKRAEEAMRQSAELGELVQLLDMASVMVLSLDHRITRWNTGCQRLYGYSPEQALGRITHDLLRTRFPDPLETMRAQLLETGRWKGELVHTTADGREVVVASEWLLWRDASGHPAAILETNQDITDRKRTEEALRSTAAELDRSNKDLEQFAYVASHDLQEPLRMVSGYLQLLSDRYKSRLDEKADIYIGYAVDGAQRMAGLINDLLAYSRVNTRSEPMRPTSGQEAFDIALRNLRSAIEESHAAITHDPLPVVRADRTQLVQLFQNLVGNAVKYRSPDRPSQVHVSVRKEAGEWLFSVADNGIGFEQKYEKKLFMIFQRLHARGKYPGTGVGLAICKRIVERHGGRIWATGEPDKGATFYFTIPSS